MLHHTHNLCSLSAHNRATSAHPSPSYNCLGSQWGWQLRGSRKSLLTAVLVKKKKKRAGSRGLTPGRGIFFLQRPSPPPLFSLCTDCNKKHSREESLVAVLTVYPQLHRSLWWSPPPPLQRVRPQQRAGSRFLRSLFQPRSRSESAAIAESLWVLMAASGCVCVAACVHVCVCAV